MFFIGDVHGCIEQYTNMTWNMNCSIQVGDMGLGFPRSEELIAMEQHKFIRGNHDNPAVCRAHPNYLGDYGFLEKPSIYYISGAYSIDRNNRRIGVNYWDDEELPYTTFKTIIEDIAEKKPRIIVSHDCPISIGQLMFAIRDRSVSRTAQALEEVFAHHKPSLWVFGHHHETRSVECEGTEFQCIAPLAAYEIPNLTW